MPSNQPGKNPFFTNPFFMVLLGVSIAFVLSALAYLVSPYAFEKAPVGTPSRRLAEWFDARGPLVLGIEFAVMLVSGVAAMISDDWFAGRSNTGPPKPLT